MENTVTVQTQQTNPFGEVAAHASMPDQDSAMAVVTAGEVARVQGQIVSAKRFPRDEIQAYEKIMKACTRHSLAKQAVYAYPRGGQTVKGPSIRLAEQLARSWGNIDTGIRELSQENGESTVEAYCLDLETNYRASKVFTVKHERHTKKGITKLKDPRDIYELVANQGSRRMRACILAVIPGDVCEEAVATCESTLAGNTSEPLEDRLKKMVVAFKGLNETITQEMLEIKLKHTIAEATVDELNDLAAIYRSLKDGMTKRHDWFNVDQGESSETSKSLNEKFPAKTPAKKEKKETKTELTSPEEILKACTSVAELRKCYNGNSTGWEQDFGPDVMAEIDEIYSDCLADFEMGEG